MTVLAPACSERLGDERVEADKQTAAEERQNVKKVRADAHRADGAGAIGKVPDHDGVHDAHAHPADLGKDQRPCEPDGGAKFVASCLEAEHVRAKSYVSVSGAWQRSKPSRKCSKLARPMKK